MNRFDAKIFGTGAAVLKKKRAEILQVNFGKLCNLSCVHCHVEAGPTRTRENMDGPTAEAVVRFIERIRPNTLDLTGGAPEMNPYFRYLVKAARERGLHVIDRCNLTVFFTEGLRDLPDFLKEFKVEVIASLPCYSRENVDRQRGEGTFAESVEALIRLNALGYGKEGSGLALNLVYNPVGPHLPPSQDALELDYKTRLSEDFGIVFNRLYTITNMPMTRYAKYLKAFGQLEDYRRLLFESFNPSTLGGLMCRNTLSVGWDGRLYDCDFNQMLDLSIGNGRPLTITEAARDDIDGRTIRTGDHCFGCTAGAGSSCQGALR